MSTICGRLRRLRRERPGRRHGQGGRAGAPPDAETGGRRKGGFGQAAGRGRIWPGGWNFRPLAKPIHGRFGIACIWRTALRVAGRPGFFARKPRPVPYNGSTAGERARFVREEEGATAGWEAGAAPYYPYMVPRCGIRRCRAEAFGRAAEGTRPAQAILASQSISSARRETAHQVCSSART